METNFWKNLRALLVAAALFGLFCPSFVEAQDIELYGPNGDFPDASLVMPFAATGDRTAFFAISNLAPDGTIVPLEVRWDFYGEGGDLLVSVARFTLGDGGTDIVDISNIRSRDIDGVEGSETFDLSGTNGMVVVSKNDQPDLIGNWTQANLQSNSGFGANAAGLGAIGLLEPRDLFGTSFGPSSLEDNLLMVLGVNDLNVRPTSLTDGSPAAPGETVFSFEIGLYDNEVGQVAVAEVPVSGTAYFSTLQELFPGYDLNKSVTINIRPITEGVSLIGFYGQTVGPFGAGQSLRTDLYALE